MTRLRILWKQLTMCPHGTKTLLTALSQQISQLSVFCFLCGGSACLLTLKWFNVEHIYTNAGGQTSQTLESGVHLRERERSNEPIAREWSTFARTWEDKRAKR